MGGVPSKADPSKGELQVIAAGYSRTGTVSIQLALEHLLDGPVLHGGTHVLAREDSYVKKWVEFFDAKYAGERERSLKLLREVTSGYIGASDIPPILVVPELLEVYPNAKVVLIERDPRKWWVSFHGNLKYAGAWFLPVLTFVGPGLRWFPKLMIAWKREADVLMESIGKRPGDFGPELLEAHNQMIINVVPKQQLLIMKLEDGWEPLCKFLGKPIPDIPFPQVNDREAADRVGHGIFAKLMLTWLGLFFVMGTSIYFGMQAWNSGALYPAE